MSDTTGLQILATTDVMHLRLTGLILSVLVERGTITKSEAGALVQDVIAKLPRELDGFRQALIGLKNEFQ